jgi:hypothetical protein
VLVTLDSGGRLIRLREKGRRNGYVVTIESVYWLGANVKAQADKAERLAARKAKAREKRR